MRGSETLLSFLLEGIKSSITIAIDLAISIYYSAYFITWTPDIRISLL